MASIKVTLNEPGSCHIIHAASGTSLDSASSPEFGGRGGSFSATDLVVAGIGACILTSIDKVAARGGLDPTLLALSLTKRLNHAPKMIEGIDIEITHPAGFPSDLLIKLQRAASSCAVKRSLHPDIDINIQFFPAA